MVRDDGGTVTAQQSFVRALIGDRRDLRPLRRAGVLRCLISSRGKRIGDYAAGTYVVRDRVRLTLPPPAPMPPALAGWAAAADIGTPPVGLTLAVASTSGDCPPLDPASRDRLGGRCWRPGWRRTSRRPRRPAPRPWDFLAAVSAARRERDLARLHRDETLRARLTARSR